MGKKKKKGGGYRVIVTVGCALVAASLTGCDTLREWAAAAPTPPPVGEGQPQVPVVTPTGTVDLFDIATFVLAGLGLLPAARLVAASRPLFAPLILLLLGKPKPKPEPATETPSTPAA